MGVTSEKKEKCILIDLLTRRVPTIEKIFKD